MESGKYPICGQGIVLLILIVLTLLTSVPASAVYTGDSVIGRYDDWELENTPTVGMGLFPSVSLESDDDGTSAKPSTTSTTPAKTWVTISPFTATIGEEETWLIVGYVSGDRFLATITVSAKGESDSGYTDLETIKPDENGLFVWAVPTSHMDSTLFRVVARLGTSKVTSNAIRFTGETDADQVGKPVISPSRTIVPLQTGVQEEEDIPTPEYTQSRLSISTRTTSPSVGDDIIITGRLADAQGKGISGATVSIDESGYPGAAGPEPFQKTTTDSDGRFEFDLHVSFANMVGLVASYEGDEFHSPAESNTLIFSTR